MSGALQALAGLKVVELGGIGPRPFAAMVLSDFGAEVVRVERPSSEPRAPYEDSERDVPLRDRRSPGLDLMHPVGLRALRRLIDRADVLIDPFGPGVAERLGIGPEACMGTNPTLVYGRITGWRQSGPLAQAARQNLNYVELGGPLAAMGRAGEPPSPPLNLVGDFGGGGMLLAFGIVTALPERARSGRGQVVDAGIVDGVAALSACVVGFRNMAGGDERERNYLDGGAHFYDTHETADGRFVSVALLEPRFYVELLERLGLDPAAWPQREPECWPQLTRRLRDLFAQRTQAQRCELLEGTDACFAPVLGFSEAAAHRHLAARGTYLEADGEGVQPAPAPRLGRTPGAIQRPPSAPGADSADVLAAAGWTADEIAALQRCGAILPAPGVGVAR